MNMPASSISNIAFSEELKISQVAKHYGKFNTNQKWKW
jgi:hypothetical protein